MIPYDLLRQFPYAVDDAETHLLPKPRVVAARCIYRKALASPEIKANRP